MLGASHGRPPLPAVPPHPGEDGETRIAVILCKCEEAPDAVLDASALTDVSTVHTIPYLCLPDGFEQAKRLLAQSDANRVVVAACSHFSNGKLARLAGESNLPTACVQGVNLREEVAWVHGDVPGAGRKAEALVAMAVERLRLQQAPRSLDAPVTPAALVVGGGVAGLTAALSLADLGYETHLVERTDLLGGNLREVYATLNSGDPQALLRDLMAHAGRSDSLHIHTGAELCVVEGRAGEFRVTIRRKDGAAQMVQVGAIIVATGGHENRPSEYLYGQSEQVLTQRELERLLARNEPRVAGLRSVVMIQCVGSRDERHRYCSRICCTQALKNALEVKARNPDAQVVVLYRDLMSYAFREERYTEAREKGVLFVRYEPDGKPRVSAEGDRLRVEFAEPALGETVTLSPDLLVLSAGAVPDAPRDLAAMLGVELDADGFVEEAEEKFRPVETLRDGVFVCGLAHSPRDISETVAQARAAAQRAASLLAHARLQSGWAVATVNARRCSGCEVCIEVCPYNAREKDEEERVVVVRDALCRGCGACAAACPNGAAQLGGFSERQVFAMMDKV
jgi:heterodisulfide reductase subunit A